MTNEKFYKVKKDSELETLLNYSLVNILDVLMKHKDEIVPFIPEHLIEHLAYNSGNGCVDFYLIAEHFDEKYLDRNEFMKKQDEEFLKFKKSSKAQKVLNSIIVKNGLMKAVENCDAGWTLRRNVFPHGEMRAFYYQDEWYLMNRDGWSLRENHDIYEIDAKEYYCALGEFKSNQKENNND